MLNVAIRMGAPVPPGFDAIAQASQAARENRRRGLEGKALVAYLLYIQSISAALHDPLSSNWIEPEMPTDQKKKKSNKDAQLVIRIKSSERDRFVALCDELDTSAAREIRRFIREFLDEHDGKD
jgi:hypothetical protein